MNPFVEALERAEKLLAESYAEVERLRAALENAEQFLDLYVNGCDHTGDAKQTLAHARRALEQARKK